MKMLLMENAGGKWWQGRPKKCELEVWRIALGKWIQKRKVENFNKEGVGSDFREDKVLRKT
jgi:hypothetical protein